MITGDILSFDCETSGLRWSDRPFGMSVSNGTQTTYLDERRDSWESIRSLITVLNNTKVLVAQNAKFDLRMLAHWGLNPQGEVHDTEVLGRLVCNTHMQYSLDAQTKRYGLHKDDGVKIYMKKHKLKSFREVPLEIMEPYAKQDALGTFQLYHKLLADLDPRSIPVWENEIKLTKVCHAIEIQGIHLNDDYIRQAIDHEERLIREAKSQFLLTTGRIYDNKKSTLVEVFIKAGEIIPKTEKGNDQLTDAVLESFTSPAAILVQTIRHYEKRISTYYKSFQEHDAFGKIHADMRQAGTTTGRFSYREPNLQNVPKEEDSVEPFVVRGCFKPRAGYSFVSMDYSQQEYRLMLAYANHKKLIHEIMVDKKDVHQATADLMGTTRKLAKTLNFAILYGAGADKLAGMLGVSRAEAYQLKEKYFNALMEVEQLINSVTTTGRGRGHIYNWLGRKLQINNKEFAYTLPNHLIQGGGADICKIAMVRCAEFLKDKPAYMILQVHDAIVFEIPNELIAELAPELKKIMIDSFPSRNGMMMDVDISVSDKSLAERDMKPWK